MCIYVEVFNIFKYVFRLLLDDVNDMSYYLLE